MKQLPNEYNEKLLTIVTAEDVATIAQALEDVFVIHRDMYDPPHYCIKIKVSALSLTVEQQIKALDYLEEIWDRFIRPWAGEFCGATGYTIHNEGRSGGYLFVDRASNRVDEWEDFEDVRHNAQVLVKFKHEWELLLHDIKAWLNTKHRRKEELV